MDNKILESLSKYYKAANYVSACQLYLLDNPLLKRKLKKSDLKKKIVGHWGTVPGQNFIYTHLNRLISENNLNMIYISGPGHGGNSPIANTYLEGSYTEIYPDITMDEEGLKKLFKQFSFPGGVPSHAAPETPGSIHEGGELGYSLSHGFGAVLDNPDLIAACVVGDGEAETGPLANSWHGNKFLNYKTDGVVLPILNLNGYKISNPTIFSRMTDKQLGSFFYGLGWHPYLVEGNNEEELHKKMYYTLNRVFEEIKEVKKGQTNLRPMIILKTPKGFTGPKYVDGKQIEGTFNAHQVPLLPDDDEHIELLEKWLKSYHPEELFNEDGTLKEIVKLIIPKGKYRMGINPNTNGGLLRRNIKLPDLNSLKLDVVKGTTKYQDMLKLSEYIKNIYELNDNFRLFSPDEAMSNRMFDMFKSSKRDWQEEIKDTDEFLDKDGKIMDSYLSEHFCEGLLEGYLLTGRYGCFVSYEAFINVASSMISQHAKWLKVCEELDWRKDISSLNLVLTSNVWQQDHNGYTHQDPSLLNVLANKKDNIIRMYFPADSNCLLACFDKCMQEVNKINVIVASKHPSYQWLNMDEALDELEKGVKIWPFASDKGEPDIVIASCGDCPTLETLCATKILKENFPNVKIRYINILDLMVLKKSNEYYRSLSDEEYDEIFTQNKPIIMAFHGYPSLINQFIYSRHNKNITVHGYEEEGTITTPFDMRVRNKIDRYHLVIDAIEKLNLGKKGDEVIVTMEEKLKKHKEYIKENGIDMPEVSDIDLTMFQKNI